MRQQQSLPSSQNKNAAAIRRIALGAGIAIVLMIIFISSVKVPDPSWGQLLVHQAHNSHRFCRCSRRCLLSFCSSIALPRLAQRAHAGVLPHRVHCRAMVRQRDWFERYVVGLK